MFLNNLKLIYNISIIYLIINFLPFTIGQRIFTFKHASVRICIGNIIAATIYI